MDARELRIGNFYMFADYSGIVARAVKEIKHNQFGFLSDFDGVNFEICKPIPLTEEWLLKFGFDLINNEYHQSRNHDLKLHWTVNKNKMIPEFNEKRFVTGYDFKYVHQLQNLYFALTSEELTIKK